MSGTFVGGFGEEAPRHDKLELATFQLVRPWVLPTRKQGRHLIRQFILGVASKKGGGPPIIKHVQSGVLRLSSIICFVATYGPAMRPIWQPNVLVVCDCNFKKVANVCFKLMMAAFRAARKIRQQKPKRKRTRGRVIRTFFLVQAEMINQAWRNKEGELAGAGIVTMGPAFDPEQRTVIRIQSKRCLHRSKFSRRLHETFDEWRFVERNHLPGRTALLPSGPNKKRRDSSRDAPSNTLEPEAWFDHQKPLTLLPSAHHQNAIPQSLEEFTSSQPKINLEWRKCNSRLIQWTFVWWIGTNFRVVDAAT